MNKKKYKLEETQKGTATITKRPSRYSPASEFTPDYSYVIKDLKRIGLLAGSFFIILIVLSFFLR